MIAAVKAFVQDMKSKGFSFRLGKVELPSDFAEAGAETYVIAPFTPGNNREGDKAHASDVSHRRLQ